MVCWWSWKKPERLSLLFHIYVFHSQSLIIMITNAGLMKLFLVALVGFDVFVSEMCLKVVALLHSAFEFPVLC